MNDIRILLVDDHAVMRMGLASLLGTQKGLTIVGDAGDGETGLRLAQKLRPDVVIIDLLMPGMDGAETTARLKKALPDVNILILTTYGTADGIAHALKAGASGALVKTAELKELVTAIRTVAGGGRCIAPEIEQILTDDPPVPELSPRQSEVLDSVVQGLTTEDIARKIGISVQMVKEHLSATFDKIGASNRAEAVAIALRKHLLKI